MTDRALTKLRRLSDSAPLYLPARRPVGRSLTLASGREANEGSLQRCEVLPARTIDAGTDGTIEAPPLYAFALEPGRFLTDGSLFRGVIADDDVVVTEASADHRGSDGAWPSLKRLQRYPPRQRVDRAASLLTGAGGAANYGHWLYDVLPRLHILERAGLLREGDRYLVPPLDREFKHVTLELLGIDPAACIEVTGPALIEADRLVVSAGHRNHGRVEPWIPQFLRARLMPEAPQTGLRLYVNRRDTKIRKILNEAKLESALAARGFRSVSMADHGFQEKMRLYASAEFIVAPHGSGLANLAFCSPGTKIVELIGGEWYNPWFEDIARGMELQYQAVEATRTVSPAFLPDIVRHLSVDVDRVVDAVDAAD